MESSSGLSAEAPDCLRLAMVSSFWVIKDFRPSISEDLWFEEMKPKMPKATPASARMMQTMRAMMRPLLVVLGDLWAIGA